MCTLGICCKDTGKVDSETKLDLVVVWFRKSYSQYRGHCFSSKLLRNLFFVESFRKLVFHRKSFVFRRTFFCFSSKLFFRSRVSTKNEICFSSKLFLFFVETFFVTKSFDEKLIFYFFIFCPKIRFRWKTNLYTVYCTIIYIVYILHIIV